MAEPAWWTWRVRWSNSCSPSETLMPYRRTSAPAPSMRTTFSRRARREPSEALTEVIRASRPPVVVSTWNDCAAAPQSWTDRRSTEALGPAWTSAAETLSVRVPGFAPRKKSATAAPEDSSATTKVWGKTAAPSASPQWTATKGRSTLTPLGTRRTVPAPSQALCKARNLAPPSAAGWRSRCDWSRAGWWRTASASVSKTTPLAARSGARAGRRTQWPSTNTASPAGSATRAALRATSASTSAWAGSGAAAKPSRESERVSEKRHASSPSLGMGRERASAAPWARSAASQAGAAASGAGRITGEGAGAVGIVVQPTEPSISSSISRLSSTEYSIGNSFTRSLTKPLTARDIASPSERPRWRM